MLTTCILYYYAAADPGCLINCCKLCCFLSRKLNEEQCIYLSCIYCYCFVYILYRLLNKQLGQLPRKRSLSENRSYHISINKEPAFVNRETVVYLRCVILLGTNIIRCLSRNEILLLDERRQFSSIDLFLFSDPVTYYEANIGQCNDYDVVKKVTLFIAAPRRPPY